MDEITAFENVPPVMLGMLKSAVKYAPRGGQVRLNVIDGNRRGTLTVDVEEARTALGMED